MDFLFYFLFKLIIQSTKEKKQNLEHLAQIAFDQINEKKYDIDLISIGVKTIYKYGIAFANKEVAVRNN